MNKKEPKITVLMSTYNESEHWLRTAIESVLTQTFSDFEFIIINDNPAPTGNLKILQEYAEKDPRVHIHNNLENIGLTRSLNIGLELAKGKYIARMDADDVSISNRFQMQFDFMESNQDYVLCGSWMYLFNDEGLLELIADPIENEEIKSVLLMRNCIAHPTAFIRRDTLVRHQIQYDETIKYSQDYDFFCKLSLEGKLANLATPLLKYRKSETQISSKNSSQRLMAYRIRYNHFHRILDTYKIDSDEKQVLSKIKTLNVHSHRKRYLISSYYSNQNLLNSIFLPILNGDIFNLKDLYFSIIKRSYLQRQW